MKYERRLGHELNKIVGRSLSTRKKHGGRISSKNGQESHVVFRKIGNRVLYTENKRRNVCLGDAVLSTAVGGVTYISSLFRTFTEGSFSSYPHDIKLPCLWSICSMAVHLPWLFFPAF